LNSTLLTCCCPWTQDLVSPSLIFRLPTRSFFQYACTLKLEQTSR